MGKVQKKLLTTDEYTAYFRSMKYIGRETAQWCQLNVKPLSRLDIEFIHLALLTASPHPSPPLVKAGLFHSPKSFKNQGF
ncbi:hypothetical protein FACHB389_20235 [Nostoc calcicola FACHB-389]|nr:hypothetical protein FACHB389_20235 [Nostoc calcicola FACHB-389]